LRKRIALGVSIPAVVLFIGILIALLLPSNLMVLTEALDHLGLLGSRKRIAGLVQSPPGPGDAPPLCFENGRLWDALSGPRDNTGLCIAAGRILPPSPPAGRPAGARVVDATGLTILPGLIDMHVHSVGGSFAGEMMLGNGVTSARDLGTSLSGVLRYRRETEQGLRLGPRLFVTGPYLVAGVGTSDQEIGVSSPAEAVAAVSRLAQAGVDGIKVHAGIDATTLRAVVEAARARGLWVAAHLDRVSAAQAAELGVDTIEHGSGIDLDEGLAASRQRREAMEAMVARRVALTPTLVVAEHAVMLGRLARGDEPMPDTLAYVPRFFRRFWISSQIANAAAAHLSDDEIARRRARLRRLEEFTAAFHAAGGHVLVGTDAPAFLVVPGFDMHRELELLGEAGLRPDQALAAATSEAAAALGRSGDLGALSPGMRGDLLVVSGDPLAAGRVLGATRDIVLVVKDGRVARERPVN